MKLYKIFLVIILILLIIHAYSSYQVNNDINIIQINNPTKKILEENLRKKSPLIITGIMEKWDFVNELNSDNLIKKYGDVKIKLNACIVEQEKTKNMSKTIKEYFNWVHNLENVKGKTIEELVNKKQFNFYCSENFKLFNDLGILNDVKQSTKMLIPPLTLLNTYPLWIGHSHSKTGLHYDTQYRNLLCQVQGKKKIYLFAPDQSKYMYPSDKFDLGSVCSKVNFWDVDNKKFPDFNKAKYIEIILNPGQILSIPPYWWHAVENIGTNIAFSINSEPILTLLYQFPIFMKNIMHNIGVYKQQNCTCCNNS
jgi:lysine-specific demethylase 8